MEVGGGEVEAPRATVISRETGEELLEAFKQHGGAGAGASGGRGGIRVKGDGFKGLKGTTDGIGGIDGDDANIALAVVHNEKFK